ncbi:hypothetical protein BJQ96_02092 [Flavobacterium sp. PL0002]|nr:hypothetical protein [Flavobacterium sp. PL002]
MVAFIKSVFFYGFYFFFLINHSNWLDLDLTQLMRECIKYYLGIAALISFKIQFISGSFLLIKSFKVGMISLSG